MAHKTGAAFTGDHIIHGCANAMYLGKVIQFNSKDARAKSRYAYIAKEVLHLAGETEDELVASLVQKIRDLNDVLNIPQGIKNYGKGGVKADESIIDYAEFEEKKSRVAVDAIGDACTGSNPRQPTPRGDGEAARVRLQRRGRGLLGEVSIPNGIPLHLLRKRPPPYGPAECLPGESAGGFLHLDPPQPGS